MLLSFHSLLVLFNSNHSFLKIHILVSVSWFVLQQINNTWSLPCRSSGDGGKSKNSVSTRWAHHVPMAGLLISSMETQTCFLESRLSLIELSTMLVCWLGSSDLDEWFHWLIATYLSLEHLVPWSLAVWKWRFHLFPGWGWVSGRGLVGGFLLTDSASALEIWARGYGRGSFWCEELGCWMPFPLLSRSWLLYKELWCSWVCICLRMWVGLPGFPNTDAHSGVKFSVCTDLVFYHHFPPSHPQWHLMYKEWLSLGK